MPLRGKQESVRRGRQTAIEVPLNERAHTANYFGAHVRNVVSQMNDSEWAFVPSC